ncbi:MAG: sigma-70 family RNA polymerase sigma factor [Polyangiaceae bacterium]|nr:sigma-70 family RNA polymerase sigma factor [Polyangiaceae bacterium]
MQRTLRRLGVSLMDVEDLAHEVFLRVHENLSSLDPDRPVRPWLFAFCFRVAGNYRRRRREVPDDGVEAADPAPSTDELIEREQDRQLVLRALDVLELNQRAVFVLHCLDEVPVPEVASTLGIPLGTAYTRLRAARRSFEAEVRRLQGQSRGPLMARLIPDLGIAANLEALFSSPLWPKGMLLLLAVVGASLVQGRPLEERAEAPVMEPIAMTTLSATAPPLETTTPPLEAASPEAPQPTASATAGAKPAPVRTRPTSDLAAEQRILAGVQPAIEAGDAARALRLVEAHAREYPEGVLVEEREALRILALRAGGRSSEAERAKAAFGEQFPKSVLEERIER